MSATPTLSPFELANFVPSLLEKFTLLPLNPDRSIRVAFPVLETEPGQFVMPESVNRHLLALTVDSHLLNWQVDSLRSLFRGEKQPPYLGAEPEAYNDVFCILELHLLDLCDAIGDRRDLEMLEIYAALRRRPDGQSLGYIHDCMWQVAALLLGTRVLSQLEFEAIMSRLERSCRTFAQGPTSRNYLAALRKLFESDD